jgi:hypothetical protein
MIITVQCAIGSPGSKPVTQLQYSNAGNFMSLVNVGNYQYGMNDGGVWQLNYTQPDGSVATDDGLPISYVVKLNTSHFGKPNNVKKLSYIYAAMSGDYSGMTVTTRPDGCNEIRSTKCVARQNSFRAAVGSRAQGTFWTVGLESSAPFTLFNLSVRYINRPFGISNR